MGLLHLLIAALAASAAHAAGAPCQCVKPDQTIDPISNPMIFLQQPTEGGVQNGTPCPLNCTLTAHAFDEANDGLVIQILANGLNSAKITIVDGTRTWTIVKSTEQSDITWKSTTGVLVFNFEGEVSPVGTFMIVVQKSQTGRDIVASVAPPTVAVPTSPYDLQYNANPLLVANDIMIGIDLSSTDLPEFKSFATDLINTLTITNATDCGVGTRLALHGLTNYPSFSPTYFPDWQYQSSNALGNIDAMTQIGNGPFYIDDVKKFVENGFKSLVSVDLPKPGEDVSLRCLNRGRVYILFTSQQPAEFTSLPAQPNNVVDFIYRGVHPIIVTSLKKGQRGYYDQFTTTPESDGSNRWAYFNINDGVTKFINNFLVGTIPDSEEKLMACQLSDDQTTVTLTNNMITNAPATVSIPPYYEGMKPGGDEETAWDKIKHYCNFQSSTVSIEQSTEAEELTEKADVCLKVYYDLETDKDFVRIYANNGDGTRKQVVKLTGRDVSGSTFRLGSRSGSIEFSSDEKNVFDGFYAEITPC